MKKKWMSFLGTAISYLLVMGVSSIAAIYLASQFLFPAIAQDSRAIPKTEQKVTQENVANEDEPEETTVLGEVEAIKKNPEKKEGEGEITSPGAPSGNASIKSDEITSEMISQFLRPYEYEPGGRRDPFQPYVERKEISDEEKERLSKLTALERYDLDEIELLGIIWRVTKPKVMMKDPTGQVHIVGKNSKVGRNNGYIAVIREGEVVVVESFEGEGQVTYQTRILKISR